jgi:phage gpG-like protein
MSVSVRGDFAKLAKLQAKVKTLASDDRRIRLANVMGAAAVTEVQLGFRETRDPYGRAWAPLLLRQGGKPLLDTGRLRSSYSYQASMRGFTLGTNFIGAGVHQHGATITVVHDARRDGSSPSRSRSRGDRWSLKDVSGRVGRRSFTRQVRGSSLAS